MGCSLSSSGMPLTATPSKDFLPSNLGTPRPVNGKTRGNENPLTEQMTTVFHRTLESIFNLCQDDNEVKRKIVSILICKDVTEETIDQEIALFLSQDEVEFKKQQADNIASILVRKYIAEEILDQKNAFLLSQDEIDVNVKQIVDLEKKLLEGRFEATEMKLNAQCQLSELSSEEIGKIREKCDLEPTSEDLSEVASTAEKNSEFKPSSKDLIKAAFTAASRGDICRFEVFVNYSREILYKTDILGRSLLEVAADNFHSEIVQCIICKHAEICNPSDKTTVERNILLSKFSRFIRDIKDMKDRNDTWAKHLESELFRTYLRHNYKESDGLKIDEIYTRYINDKQKKIKTFDIYQYGNLAFYADLIFFSEVKFKNALKKLYPKSRLYSLLNSNGFNLVTLTAALGTPDKWKVIEKAYRKIPGRPEYSALLDNSSLIGSPIQAAFIADNSLMFNYFFNSKDGFIVNKRYGAEKNNILHTILQSDKKTSEKRELLKEIFSKLKKKSNNRKRLIESVLQVNRYYKCPLELAIEKRFYGFYKDSLYLIYSSGKGTIRDSLIANDCCLMKSALAFDGENFIRMVLHLQKMYNKGEKNRMDLLNYKIKYDEDGRLIYSELYNIACKHKNVKTARFIRKMLKSKGDVSLLK